jgi:hypothetical protein
MQSWETASGTRCDSLVTSRKVTHATTTPEFGKWLVRAMQSLNGGMSHSDPRALSSTSEQFWGRAVQASRDSFGSGTLLICGELSPVVRFSQLPPWRKARSERRAAPVRITFPGRL